MSLRLLLTFCLVLAFCRANAQQRQEAHLDSLHEVLQHRPDDSAKVEDLFSLALQYIEVNPATGIRCAQQMQQIAPAINFRMGQGDSWLALAGNEQAMGAYPAAHSHYFIALSIYEDMGFEDGAATALVDIGMLYDHENNQKKALEYELKGLAITKRLGLKKNMVQLLLNIGTVYYNMGDKVQALDYTTQAMQLARENKDDYGIITTQQNLSSIYIENGNYTQGFRYLYNALLSAQKMGDKRIVAENYNNIGVNYIMIADTAAIAPDSLIPASKAARLHLGIQYLKQGIDAATEINAKDLLINNYESLATALAATGDYKAAFEAHRRFTDVKDSVYTNENKETIKNLEDKREIDLRDKQLKITALQLAVQKRQRWMYAGGIGLLAVIGVLLYLQSASRRKANKQLARINQQLDEANRIKARFFGILSHDLRAPVANLAGYLHLQREAPEMMDEQAQAQHRLSIELAANNLLSVMEDLLLWSKGQMVSFKPQLRPVHILNLFNEIQKLVPQGFGAEVIFENPDNLNIETDENFLKTIMRNLTANALKALGDTPNGKVVWKAWKEGDKNYLSITDNGPGISKEQLQNLFTENAVTGSGNGLGLHIVKDFAQMLGQQLEVKSEPGKGTSFILSAAA